MAAPRLHGARRALPATLVEVAGHRLRDAILSGALQPGDKIVEEQLCADFGISRAPLREALRLLAQQGMVAVRHPAVVCATACPGTPARPTTAAWNRRWASSRSNSPAAERICSNASLSRIGSSAVFNRRLPAAFPPGAKDPVEVDESDVVAGH